MEYARIKRIRNDSFISGRCGGRSMAIFNELVNQIDENIEQQRDRGTAFEKLAVAYSENEPAFKNNILDVFLDTYDTICSAIKLQNIYNIKESNFKKFKWIVEELTYV